MAAAAMISFFYALPQATGAAALAISSAPGLRGMVGALYNFVVAIIGLVVAPTMVAVLTDHVFADSAKVHYSLALVVLTSAAVGLWLMMSARRHFRPHPEEAPA